MGRSPIAFHPCPSFSPAPEGGSPGRRSAASRPPASPRRGGQAGLPLGMLRILCAQPLPAARLVVLARAGRRGAPGFALAPLAAATSPLLPQPGPGAAAAAAAERSRSRSQAASPTCTPAADGPISPLATEMRLGQLLWSHP
ncbi:unnamed protein product [Natator depressus]